MKPPVTISDVSAWPEPAGAFDSAAPQAHSAQVHDIAEVYRRHGQRIYRFCRNYLRNEADAQDATQETFVRASQQLHRVRTDTGAYLTGIARNVCYDHRRYNPDRCVPIDGEERPDPRQRPEHLAVERSVMDRLWVGLNRNERVLLAHAFAGFSYEEISGITGMSAKAVSVAITRARQRARRLAAIASAALLGGPAAGWLRRLLVRSEHVAVALSATEQAAVLAISFAVGIGTPAITVAATPPMPMAQQAPGSLTMSSTRVASDSAAPLAGAGTPSPVAARHDAALPAYRPARPLLDNTAPGPQDVDFTSFTPSPQYAQDHTVFAAGSRGGCSTACSVIFRSSDAGRSWSFVGYGPGGPVVLPPAYPADRALYVAGGNGLQRSDDGGASFRLVAPISGPTAAAPNGSPGAASIVIAGSQTPQLWVYSEASNSLAPGPSLPLGLFPDALTFVDADQFVVAAHNVTQNAPGVGRTYFIDCNFVSCSTSASFDGYSSVITFASTSANHGDVVAFAGSSVYSSNDAGRSFRATTTSPWGTVTAASFFGSPSAPLLLISAARSAVGGATGTLAISADGGATFTTLSQSFAGPTLVTTLGGLSDGHVLAYLAATGSGGSQGLRCSTNGARSWASTC